MARERRPWRSADIAEMRALARRGHTIVEAARIMGRDSGSLSSAASRHKIQFGASKTGPRREHRGPEWRVWTPEAADALRRCIDAGQPVSAAASATGYSRDACIGKAYRMGLSFSGKKLMPAHRANISASRRASGPVFWTSERMDEMAALASAGWSQSECAVYFRKSLASVAQAASRHEISFHALRPRKTAEAPSPGHSALSTPSASSARVVNADQKA